MVLLIVSAAIGFGRPASGLSAISPLGATANSSGSAQGLGPVTAHDGKFWVAGREVFLRGVNMGVSGNEWNYATLDSWGMNLIRMEYNWWQLEPNPPVKNGGSWTHNYDATYVAKLRKAIGLAGEHGIYVVIKNTGCTYCGEFRYPDWQYQAQYNSHGITYSSSAQGQEQADGDFWSDPLRKEFMISAWLHLIGQLKDLPAVTGYEVLNEPKVGPLPHVHSTTQMVVDWQVSAAQRIRQADPGRIVFFTTRAGYGPGVSTADLSGFGALGNAAFDIHDYFGGRWGDGYGGTDPSKDDYEEVVQDLYAHVSSEDPDCSCDGQFLPYIGTTYGHVRFIQHIVDALRPWGFPLLVGEFGVKATDPGAMHYFGNVTSAANHVGVSWAASGFTSDRGLLNEDGSFKPWTQLVIDAARYRA